ncbi:MAG TPA: hypothetical protein PLI62_01220 [Spirochaetota bacterium]|nr:hypothetical protein [Spirochaetota bacterium]HQP47697.1 hypothetical protein [Spirochaetota bacterium]
MEEKKTAMDNKGREPDKDIVTFEANEILGSDDVIKKLKIFKADTREKEIAVEFVQSYVNFMEELVTHDLQVNLNRNNVEIRDLVSHVNSMMREKSEFIFNTMVLHSPAHYRNIQTDLLKKGTAAEE